MPFTDKVLEKPVKKGNTCQVRQQKETKGKGHPCVAGIIRPIGLGLIQRRKKMQTRPS